MFGCYKCAQFVRIVYCQGLPMIDLHRFGWTQHTCYLEKTRRWPVWEHTPPPAGPVYEVCGEIWRWAQEGAAGNPLQSTRKRGQWWDRDGGPGSSSGTSLSTVMFASLNWDCQPTILQQTHFADHTIIMGLIRNGDVRAFRDEVQILTAWCFTIHLILNNIKTKEKADPNPVGGCREGLWFQIPGCSCKTCLGHCPVTGEAQQHLYFLRKL